MHTYPIKLKKGVVLIKKLQLKKSVFVKQILVGFHKYSNIVGNDVVKATKKTIALAEHYKKNISINSLVNNYQKNRRVMNIIIICVIIFDCLLSLYLYNKFLAPISLAEKDGFKRFYSSEMAKTDAQTKLEQIVSEKTNELFTIFKKTGLTTMVVGKIKKPELKVYGSMVALGSDNISIFEYIDSSSAKIDADLLTTEFNNNFSKNKTMGLSHIYMKDNLLIIYYGEKKTIIKPLTTFAGNSLLDSKYHALAEAK